MICFTGAVSSSIELRNQFRLQVVFDVVHKEVHHSFGNAVLNIFSHDQEVGLDQAFYRVDMIYSSEYRQQLLIKPSVYSYYKTIIINNILVPLQIL